LVLARLPEEEEDMRETPVNDTRERLVFYCDQVVGPT
jgi:hypothetical protein